MEVASLELSVSLVASVWFMGVQFGAFSQWETLLPNDTIPLLFLIAHSKEQAQLAASSIGSIVNGGSTGNGKEPAVATALDVQSGNTDTKMVSTELPIDPSETTSCGMKMKEVPNRCTKCCKRVGLTGFNCSCGNLFCAAHRYSDKHDCPFDYRATARDAIAKANLQHHSHQNHFRHLYFSSSPHSSSPPPSLLFSFFSFSLALKWC
ncbi:hypothetical protein J1N35_022343 [Gossypium stocksii]|uniref:AN1-type domain-containing protein n=1 Tax=Gossypium stocksii TaxID=47602 RepID=A0A9D4A2N8_9ROSI|nr:hypothetical protein J1N35_022343 [Gossypium stocksii]